MRVVEAEIKEVIDLIRERFDNQETEIKVRHHEPGIMHTIQVGRTTYRAVAYLGGEWKIIEMK